MHIDRALTGFLDGLSGGSAFWEGGRSAFRGGSENWGWSAFWGGVCFLRRGLPSESVCLLKGDMPSEGVCLLRGSASWGGYAFWGGLPSGGSPFRGRGGLPWCRHPILRGQTPSLSEARPLVNIWQAPLFLRGQTPLPILRGQTPPLPILRGQTTLPILRGQTLLLRGQTPSEGRPSSEGRPPSPSSEVRPSISQRAEQPHPT